MHVLRARRGLFGGLVAAVSGRSNEPSQPATAETQVAAETAAPSPAAATAKTAEPEAPKKKRGFWGVSSEAAAGTIVASSQSAVRFPRAISPAQRSPAFARRGAIVRNVKVWGSTVPCSISAHVHGAETGAPGRARTV